MGNIIAAAVFALVIGLVIFYIIRQKKKGVRCIGCPHAGKCSKQSKCSHK